MSMFSKLPSFRELCASFEDDRHVFNSRMQGPASSLTALPRGICLPSPPMSGSPFQEESHDIPQRAAQRRERPDPLSPTLATLASSANRLPLAQGLRSSPSVSQASHTTIPGQTPGDHYAIPQQPLYRGELPSVDATTQLDEGRPHLRSAFPTSARKPKAHVASACTNCQKKHLRCDATRPCRRCVQSGKEVDTTVTSNYDDLTC